MTTAIAHELEPGPQETEQLLGRNLHLAGTNRRGPYAHSVDATQGSQIGSRSYDDATQGRQIGSTPHNDATQAR